MLEYLRAPIVEEIVIWGHVADSENCTHLERFLIRSSCSPRSLRLRGLLDQSMETILQKYPSFIEVAVIDADEDEERKILSAFLALFSNSKSVSSAPALPYVRTIRFACRHTDAILCPLLLTMLESRWNAGKCALKTAEFIFLDSPARPDPQSVARIEELRGAGLQISLLSEDDAVERVNQWLFTAGWT
ncbi:hypothetical protein MSAN_01808500 [Mycena sanguinolenta]|uniref:Uncharacterized protein n=1 Tax=Mycena sanguinolenta TaxID=230812 RepID=A0A8H7CSQ2_9AGAR|nr:hypothetical protein MSAN_01808500 [Mycena sanguinolenta]